MLDYNLEKRGEASLYEYVYQQIRDDIVAVSYTHLTLPTIA